MNNINKWAILDSGATSNFHTTSAPITNVQLVNKPIVAHLPNGDKVQSTHTCTLDLPKLPAATCLVHIIPGLASDSLVSVVTLYNAECEILFTKIGCTITLCGCTILCGSKCMCTELWMIPLVLSMPTRTTPTTAVPPSLPLAALSQLPPVLLWHELKPFRIYMISFSLFSTKAHQIQSPLARHHQGCYARDRPPRQN